MKSPQLYDMKGNFISCIASGVLCAWSEGFLNRRIAFDGYTPLFILSILWCLRRARWKASILLDMWECWAHGVAVAQENDLCNQCAAAVER